MRGLFAVVEWLSAFLLVLMASPAGQALSFLSQQKQLLLMK